MKNFTQLLPGRDGSNAKTNNTSGHAHAFTLILTLLLTFGVGEVWADSGFFSSNQWKIGYNDGADRWTEYQNDGATVDLGIKTTLSLIGCNVKTWGNVKTNLDWWKSFDSSLDANDSGTGNFWYISADWNGDHEWYMDCNDYNMITEAPNNPGNNTLYMKWSLRGYNTKTGQAKVTFTIPGFKKTSASQTFDNTTVGSNSSKTISFGQHYGTALSTSNCALSGTNSTEFEVTSISETGVTVKFKPSTAGDKSATLTITDAHSKTCTITLSGKAQYTLTYSVGSVAGTDGSFSTSPSTSSGSYVDAETNVTLTAPEAKTGYTWKGWYTDAAGTTGKIEDTNRAITVTMDADKTLYACYTENNYTVTVNAGSHGSVASASVTGHKDTKVTLPTATADLGYYFTGWTTTTGTVTYTNQSSASSAQVNGLTAAATVQANFAPIWALVGSMNSWDATTNTLGNFTIVSTKDYGYVDVDLNANTQYSFKIKNVQASAFYKPTSSNTEITYANKATAQGMNNTAGGNPNQTIMTAGKGTYRFTWNATDHSITVTYPTSYTVTFGYGTGGSAVTATVEGDAAALAASGKYAAADKDITFTQTPSSSGYTFKGWYTTADGNTTVSGMSTSDYVYDDIATNISVYAQYTANNYTVHFNVNGGTASTPSDKNVTFGSAYGTLPSSMTHASKTFVGWYTDPDDGEGDLITAETIVSTASEHTLYAHYENVYSVNVNFKCGSDVLYPATSVNASPTSLAPEISAPSILGYNFVNWTGENATFGNANNATTTVNATAATTVTANYNAVPTVYFKNNLGWEHVYVTFNSTWSNGTPCNNGNPYFEMTQMGESDIFYCAIPSTYTANNYESWAWNIAFDNHGFSASENVGTFSGGFNTGEFVGRGDFDPKATMFIPYNGDKEGRNGGTYYKTGCWMKYNSTESGYKVKVNKKVTGTNADTLTVNLTADIAGGYEFSAIVNLKSANYGYGIKLYKDYQKNTTDIYYSNKGSIHSNTTTLPWEFATKIDGKEVNADTHRCELYTEALGGYKITVSFATGKPMVDVTYPVSTGDWKLIYKDRATWSNGAHTPDWQHPSRVIKAKAGAEDIVSFYVAYGSTHSVELHKCTNVNALTGAQTWVKQSDVDLRAITETGIYNFKVSQNAEKAATVTVDGAYAGNFYIRTDVSDGGWSNYKTSGTNTMTYSEYAEENSGFTHYFMHYVHTGTNIKFCIANDYSECISDTLVGDSFTGEYIAIYGNVRFMWDQHTNKVSRAYISGSTNVYDRFLVLQGDAKMFNKAGTALTGNGRVNGLNEHEMNFTDDQNWIYEATVQAQPGARFKLTAKYNNKVQYFYGDEDATDQLLGGDGKSTTKYTIRIVYDFKTNRLIKAFIPSGTISDNLSIEADLMIIREHQEDAQQINFTGSGALSKVKTVYGAMKFNKWTVNGKEKTGGHASTGASRYQRDLFYISFPFDVELSEVFGFGTYGTHWIIEYYDGKGRAKNGFWADSDSYWKFVLPSQRNSFTLKAFEGYILALDLDEMTESSSIWNHGVEDVYVYFPSSAAVNNIQAISRLIPIDQEGYQCQIGPRFDGGDDRRLKDSYWHVIGVPSFANYNSTLTETNGGTAIDWSNGGKAIDWRTPSLPYLYEWNSADNSLTVTTSATFNFKATYSYMVQYAGASIYWSAINATPPSVVARKNDNQPTSAEFRLELQQTGKAIDQTFVRLTDEVNVTTGFDFNYDLSKEMNANKANIFTMITTAMDDGNTVTESAANCLPMSEQTTVVPVGVKIAANDDYTFSIPDGANGVGVTLIDNLTGTRTNLSAVDYTVSLEAGTYNERFTLEISPIQYLPTELEQSDINNQMSDVRKVLIDGLLYIVHDNKMYDARGARVE